MANILSHTSATADDPIYSGGVEISSHPAFSGSSTSSAKSTTEASPAQLPSAISPAMDSVEFMEKVDQALIRSLSESTAPTSDKILTPQSKELMAPIPMGKRPAKKRKGELR